MNRNSAADRPRPRILIVGGGVAGASLAIKLDHQRFNVTLVERDEFPRFKVCGCCLGGPGMRLLEQLGVADTVAAASVPTRHWMGYVADHRVSIAIPAGIAVSRRVLDPILISRARLLGCKVLQPMEAKIEGGSPAGSIAAATLNDVACATNHGTNSLNRGSVEVRVGPRSEFFDLVFVASGLSGFRVGDHLPWREKPSGPHGFAVEVYGDIRPETVHMICGDNGYAGLVKLAHGRIDVAAALLPANGRSGVRPNNRSPTAAMSPLAQVQSMVYDALGDRIDWRSAGEVLTTGLLRRQRRILPGPIIAIGDASGYVEPFTGEGMTWAMSAAIRAAETLNAADDIEHFKSRWPAIAAELSRRRKWRCRVLTTSLRRPLIRHAAGWTLSKLPSLAAPLIRQITG